MFLKYTLLFDILQKKKKKNEHWINVYIFFLGTYCCKCKWPKQFRYESEKNVLN